jgi:hypothetical protein
MYFDMFFIQWHHLAKKDLWNKVYVIITMIMKSRIAVVWDIKLYSLIQLRQHFSEHTACIFIAYLHSLLFSTETGDSIFLQNCETFLQDYIV